MTSTKVVTIKGKQIRVTQHGKPEPQLVQKAYERMISSILREYDERQKQPSSLAIPM